MGVIYMNMNYECSAFTPCDLTHLSLSPFTYISTVSFSNPPQPKPFRLKSLAAPFIVDQKAAIVLLGLFIFMVLLLLKARGDWNSTEVVLSVFSALVSQFNGNAKTVLERRCKAGWILLLNFISIGCTNILQSIVVAPSVHDNSLNIRDMLRDNFTFMTDLDLLEWIRYRNDLRQSSFDESESRKAEKTKMIEIEAELVFRMQENQTTGKKTCPIIIQDFSEGQKKMWLQDDSGIEVLQRIPEEVGRDLLVGKERLFSYPFWWSFEDSEREAHCWQNHSKFLR